MVMSSPTSAPLRACVPSCLRARPIRAKYAALGFILVCLPALNGRAHAAPPGAVKLLCDFEQQDWQDKLTASAITIERSTEQASRGAASLKVTFPGFGPQVDPNRLLHLNLAPMGAADWQGWDALTFDVYNPAPVALRVSARLIGRRKGGRKAVFAKPGFTAPPGWCRFALSTRGPHGGQWYQVDAEDVDRTAFVTFWIGIRGRDPDEAVLYLDNIRLVNSLPGRMDRLSADLRRLEAAGPGERGPEGDRNAGELRRLIGATDALLEKVRAAGQADEIEQVVPEVDALERDAAALVDATARSALRSAAAMIALPTPARDPGASTRLGTWEGGTWERFGAPPEPPEAQALRAIEHLHGILTADLARARLNAAIARHFGEQDFAIGIPPWPQAFGHRPQDYDGPLGTQVHLSAARHEHEPFQLVILPTKWSLSGVRVRASDLSGPGTIDAGHIEIAPMGWQWFGAEERWRATMLRPDVDVFDVEADAQQPVWINVYVPRRTPPGHYRGTITISAESMRPQDVSLALTVRPFTLPRYPAMKSAGAAGLKGAHADAYVRFLIAHRWNCHRLYMHGPQSYASYTYENFRKWHDWGGTFFNLYWANQGRCGIVTGPDGRTHTSEEGMGNIFGVLDPLINDIKAHDPDFLKACVVYGFDEPSPAQMPALEEMFGALKERYGPDLRTYFATHIPMWDDYGIAKNVDIWAVQPTDLTAEARDRLHAAGRQILAYNIRGSLLDPVGDRVQFWSYFKDGFDGVLHYNPHKGGEGTPMAGPWAPTLFPATRRTDGGIQRVLPGGAMMMSTIAFEYWREGLEDVDYLHMLRDLRGALAAAADPDGALHNRLLRQADRLVNVPETITTGCLGDRSASSGEIIQVIHGTTKDMRVVLDVRREIAELIVRIQEELGRR